MAIRKRITKAVVDAQAPRRREFIVWDDQIPRFGLRVRPTGGKAYVLRLRVDGRQRWYTIGQHGDPWTPDTAREEAGRVLGQAAKVRALRETGSDTLTTRHPIEAREYRRTIPTLAEFAKRYVDDYARPHKKASSLVADVGNLRRAILPALGSLRLNTITREDVTRFHVGRQSTPTNANRCLALLAHMFATAEVWGLRPQDSNPCVGVKRFPEARRERYLDGAELARMGAAIRAIEKAGRVTPWGLAAIRLLVFTGARASEILGLTWDGVNLRAGTVRVPAKNGPRTVILNPPTAAVLAKLHRVTGNPYVIVGDRNGKPLTLSGLEQAWQEVRKIAKLADPDPARTVRLHDLRHSFASVHVSAGGSLPIIGALLGHSQPQTTARYAHLSADPLKAASSAVAATIAAAMRSKRPRVANIVPMRRAR